MSLNLYEISKDYAELLEYIENNDISENTELETMLNSIETTLDNKLENCIYIYKKLEAKNELCKAEIERISKIKKSAENAEKRLKAYMLQCLEMSNISKKEIGTFKLSIRKGVESVHISDADNIPDMFCVFNREVSKSKIKDFLKAGGEINGANLKIGSNSLQIK